MKPYGTRIMAWGPLAQGAPDLQSNPILKALSEKYGKTPQQVALRYLLQRDIIAIPKSTHVERMLYAYSRGNGEHPSAGQTAGFPLVAPQSGACQIFMELRQRI